MKKFLLVFSFFVVLHSKTEAQYDRGYISFQTFYDELSPYGTWMYSQQYGYVWAPAAHRYFKPYASDGNWMYTQYGWTWVSDYSWGWAPFHYGRWIFDDWRGWLWVPGYDWAPAWVAWGSYGGNYGWAPLAPGINIHVGFGWRPPSGWWTFVPGNRFGDHNWSRYAVQNDRNITVNNITIINNVYNDDHRLGKTASSWMRGPEPRDVERATNSRVRTMDIANAGNPSADRIINNRVTIYRPEVTRKTEARPRVVEDKTNIRPANRQPDNNYGNAVSKSSRPATQQPVAPAVDSRSAAKASQPVMPERASAQTARPAVRQAQPGAQKPETRSIEKSVPTAAPRRSAQ